VSEPVEVVAEDHHAPPPARRDARQPALRPARPLRGSGDRHAV